MFRNFPVDNWAWVLAVVLQKKLRTVCWQRKQVVLANMPQRKLSRQWIIRLLAESLYIITYFGTCCSALAIQKMTGLWLWVAKNLLPFDLILIATSSTSLPGPISQLQLIISLEHKSWSGSRYGLKCIVDLVLKFRISCHIVQEGLYYGMMYCLKSVL